jgi:Holliday junction resolvase RusA-like endonuclease
MIEITLPLKPIPWAAAKLSRGRAYDIRGSDKQLIKFLLRQELPTCSPIRDYTSIRLKFTFEPPKFTSKKKRLLMLAGDIIPTSCDCTNLQKLYEDCLKGIVIDDDRKVANIFSEKVYGEKESILIQVFTLEEYRSAHNRRRD